MATENIKLISTNNQQGNFAVDAGYFYTFDNQQDNLIQKTDDGNTAFSYPLDTLMSDTASDAVVRTEFDGVYFWTLQNFTSTTIAIRRWKLDNFVCKLQQTISGSDINADDYDSEAFSVAHYHTSFSGTTNSGTSTIYMDKYADDSTLMGFTTTAGDGLILHLGPNTNGQEEDVEVTGTAGDGVAISGTTQYDYTASDEINFYTYLWIFNDNAGGALYKADAYTGVYITKYTGGAYSDISAATFYNVDSFASYGAVDTLAYIKGTNILFVNVGAAGATLPYYGSMVMENIQDDETTVIPVQDLAMDDQNIYRLQLTGDGATSSWITYSYELSSLDAFITSISLAAYPAILAANGIATSSITAIVKDQFLQPITNRLVTFTEDDPNGTVAPVTGNTDSNGVANTVYTSGITAREVLITATAEQT